MIRLLRKEDVEDWLALRREALRHAGRAASETRMALPLELGRA